jgi:hypothetical protein
MLRIVTGALLLAVSLGPIADGHAKKIKATGRLTGTVGAFDGAHLTVLRGKPRPKGRRAPRAYVFLVVPTTVFVSPGGPPTNFLVPGARVRVVYQATATGLVAVQVRLVGAK